MLSRIARMVASGVQVIALLALSDDGVPSYNRKAAADLAAVWPDEPEQRSRALAALIEDGLVEPLDGDRYRLPA